MANRSAKERDYQQYFETNPAALASLGFSDFRPHLVLRTAKVELIPDFFVKPRYTSLFELCEIKTPYEHILKRKKNRVEFYAPISSEYSGQLRQYAEFFEEKANRDAFTAEYGIVVPPYPRKTILVGSSRDIDKVELHRILFARGFDFELITYDDLLGALSDLCEELRYEGNELFGITISIFLRIWSVNSGRDEYVLDLHEPATGERLSLLVGADNNLKFVATNSEGRTEVYPVALMTDLGEAGRWRHLQFSLGSKRGLCRVEIRQNGASILRTEVPREFFTRRGLDYTNILIGTDFTRSKGARFDFSFERVFNYYLDLGEQMAEDEFGRRRMARFTFAEDKQRFLRANGNQWLAAGGPFRSGAEPQLEAYYEADDEQNVVR